MSRDREAALTQLGWQARDEPPDRKSADWDHLVAAIAQVKGREICGAKKKSDGWPCEASPKSGKNDNGRCKYHGGNSRAGPAHHNWKNGRQSKYFAILPEKLRAAYALFLEDPEYLSLRAEIALTDTRMYELLERIDTGESTEHWQALDRQVSKLLTLARDANGDLDPSRLRDEVDRVVAIITDARSHERLWRDLFNVMEHRRGLVEIDRRRIESEEAMVSTATALALVGALVDIVARHVNDERALSAVYRDVNALVGQPGEAAPKIKA